MSLTEADKRLEWSTAMPLRRQSLAPTDSEVPISGGGEVPEGRLSRVAYSYMPDDVAARRSEPQITGHPTHRMQPHSDSDVQADT